MTNILKFIFYYLLADFLSGLLHWYEDVFLNPEEFKTKEGFLYDIAKDNKEHHEKPRKMVKSPWYETIQVTICFVAPLAVFGFYIWGFDVELFIFWIIVSFLNQIHKWQHMTITERPLLVSWLMAFGIIAGQKHHAKHHIQPFDKNYCILSPYLNPILDKTGFWKFLEKNVNCWNT